jgi:hypothetical protein
MHDIIDIPDQLLPYGEFGLSPGTFPHLYRPIQKPTVLVDYACIMTGSRGYTLAV